VSKTFPCPNPPGGQMVCEDHQFGMCGYRKGQKVGGCLNRPSAVANIRPKYERNIATVNWILSELLGTSRASNRAISPLEHDMLRSGRFLTDSTDVYFSLPEDLDLDDTQGTTLRAH
jgi:hypothetical protein